MTIERFEDLECWIEARVLTRVSYQYVKQHEFSRDFRLSSQFTAASVSVMNNIAEDFDAGSNKEFIRFLRYSRRSCSEVQNCLYVAIDCITQLFEKHIKCLVAMIATTTVITIASSVFLDKILY